VLADSKASDASASKSSTTPENRVDQTTDVSKPESPISCTPGTGCLFDQTYIDTLRQQLPPSYIDQLSDNQLFTMADTYCNSLGEPSALRKMDDLIQKSINRGTYNDTKLFAFSLYGATLAYCIDYATEVKEYLSTLPDSVFG
jgi:hypothetical protein